MSAAGASAAAAAPPLPPDWIVPDWPASAAVRALVTTRTGGVSEGAWGAGAHGGMNVGVATGDRAECVERNRALLRQYLPSEPRWLALQHGAAVVAAEEVGSAPGGAAGGPPGPPTAVTPGVVCCVTVADCLPVLLADRAGSVVAAVHAGWRGLAAGIIQATVTSMRRRAPVPIGPIDAFLGPAIGPARFEVGAEVLDAMRALLPDAVAAFVPAAGGKYLADLGALARQALGQVGVRSVYGGRWCTASDPERFYSFRRDKVTGRHAALIWLQPSV